MNCTTVSIGNTNRTKKKNKLVQLSFLKVIRFMGIFVGFYIPFLRLTSKKYKLKHLFQIEKSEKCVKRTCLFNAYCMVFMVDRRRRREKRTSV